MYVKIILILLFSAFFIGCEYLFPPFSGEKITPLEAYNYISKNSDNPDLIIIDLRTKNEFDSLHIDKAVNLDFSMPDFPVMIEKLNRDKRYILIDNNGVRSAMAIELMKELKFQKVHFIIGGIENWYNEKLPVISN